MTLNELWSTPLSQLAETLQMARIAVCTDEKGTIRSIEVKYVDPAQMDASKHKAISEMFL